MASIFHATDLRSGRPVAIKVPHLEAESDPVFFERFQREIAIGQKVDHPGVIKVSANHSASSVYMVMEWAEGRPLRAILASEGRLTRERSARIALAICDALECLHGNGVVHRDLKPENILVDLNDGIKIIDFGIAYSADSRRLTFGRLSQLMGSVDYISPEQVKGKRGDQRSDLYALGVMFYEMLTGRVPFNGANLFSIMNDRVVNDPMPPREIDPEISPQLQEIIYRALERDPKERYANAREFAWDLRHQDQVAVEDRTELVNWKKRKSPMARTVLSYVLLGLIPVLIFGLLLFVARRA